MAARKKAKKITPKRPVHWPADMRGEGVVIPAGHFAYVKPIGKTGLGRVMVVKRNTKGRKKGSKNRCTKKK